MDLKEILLNIISIEAYIERLEDYGLRRRDAVNDELVERVKDLIMLEICTGANSLSGYRTMWHVLRLRHKIHVPRRVTWS